VVGGPISNATPEIFCCCKGRHSKEKQKNKSVMKRVLSVILCLTGVVVMATVCDPDGMRTDCGYVGINQQQCEAKGCCWSPASGGRGDIPWCFYASNPASGYSVKSSAIRTDGMDLTLALNSPSGVFGGSTNDISPLAVSVTYETQDRIRVKIYDSSRTRWEVPESFLPTSESRAPAGSLSAGDLNYKFTYTQSPFGFQVMRVSDGEVIFNTSTTRSLIFQDQYLEISSTLPDNANIYGFGERVDGYRLQNEQKTYTMWSLDSGTPPNQNLYGVHPYYMELRNGKAHGVFLKNSNGMDVNLKPNLVTYQVIGGVLDFYIFVGPTPKQVTQQYHGLIGKPYFTPLWSLGWHQCRWGTTNLDVLKQVVQNYSTNNIPLDTVWSDIDYMNSHEDFSWDPTNFPQAQMKQFVDSLHTSGKHYVVIVDPGIPSVTGYYPYDEGVRQNVFVKTAQGNIFVGKVWPGLTAFPDFSHPNTSGYWHGLIDTFLQTVAVDGLWIDMNEPSNFCDGACVTSLKEIAIESATSPNNPPYAINNGNNKLSLHTKTLDMDAVHYAGIEYDLHSLYGFTEQIATRSALEKIRGKRAFSLSRSTFAGSGKHGAHWLGDNYSTWDSMKASIPGAMLMNLFGIPMVGADICGFIYTTTEELCVRWHAMGAFFPFARNHNEINAADQYPYLVSSNCKSFFLIDG
jgi:alpha-glucosidase